MTRAQVGDFKEATGLLEKLTARKDGDADAWRLLVRASQTHGGLGMFRPRSSDTV